MENQKQSQYEEEIDLRDYINVLLKRKKEILAIFFVVVILTAVISLIMPKTFETKSLLKVGQIQGKNIESIGQTTATVLSLANLEKIGRKLGIDTISLSGRIKLNENTGFLAIIAKGSTPEETVQLANAVSEMIIERHEKIIAQAQTALEQEIQQIQNQINDNETAIELSQETIKDLKEESQIMQKKVEDLLEEKGSVSEGRGLIVQTYIEAWQSSKNEVRNEKAKLESLKAKSQNLITNLREKELQKTYSNQLTQIEIPAVPPETRIAPNRTQNVMIAGILGLFIGTFFAFASEYFRKVKL
ncbi:Wzz/FepE/Etk N-terminal domain-containing protein [Patescibacteria group bacterium AH-259-L07]|nr:Wzz/FepE/Etk N-terminal domain-containing protein [Patescibacteria group bacterium AH-259-L07]